MKYCYKYRYDAVIFLIWNKLTNFVILNIQ